MIGTQQELSYPKPVEMENPLFAAILQAVASPILLINPQGHIEWLNIAAQRLFAEEFIKRNLPLDESRSRDLLALTPPTTAPTPATARPGGCCPVVHVHAPADGEAPV